VRLNLNAVVFPFLLLSHFTLPALAQDTSPRPRLISVTGTAEVNVAPDEVVLSLGVESRDKDLALAKAQHDHRVKKLLAEAHDAGVEGKYIQTSMLQMRPDYSDEKVPRFLAYQVSQTIQVTLKDLSKYERMITKLLEAGVNRIDSVEFLVAEPRKYRDEARAKAIKAAREKAVAMAAELGQTIGKPWTSPKMALTACSRRRTDRYMRTITYRRAATRTTETCPPRNPQSLRAKSQYARLSESASSWNSCRTSMIWGR
jgi:uncharacterized protein YggE